MKRLLSRLHDAFSALERDRTGTTLRLLRAAAPAQVAGLLLLAGYGWFAGFVAPASIASTVVTLGGLAFVGWLAVRKRAQRERLLAALVQAAMTVAAVELGGGSPIALAAAVFSLVALALLDDWRVTALFAGAHTGGVVALFGVNVLLGATTTFGGALLEAAFITAVAVPVSLRCYLSAGEQRRLSEAARWLEEQFESVQEVEIAEQANQAKTEFLANMSHEIRTPLTAIRGFAELAGEPDITNDERGGYLLTIRRNSDHLLEIINDILDLSKIEAGKMSVERLTTEPAAILSDVIQLLRARAAEKGLSFGARYETPVPQQVTTDPTRLRQILVNLVSNAIKFTEEGGVEIRVRFDDEPTPMLRFEVRDSGIGLSEEQRQRLFQAFSQADTSTTRKFGGTGLGLVISQQMAELLGGTIEVESEAGVGSSFIASICTGDVSNVPRDAMFVHAMRRDSEARCAARAIDCTGARVLLAEDGIDNQRLIGTLIRKSGAALDIVDNGADALASALRHAAAGQPYDVVFMDMQMPVMDGYTATRTLRQRDYEHTIVALTAHAMATERQRCLDAGCDAFLSKPVDRLALITVIRDAFAANDAGFERHRANSLQLPVIADATACAANTDAPVPARETPPASEPPTVNEPTGAGSPPIRSDFDDDPDFAELIVEFVAGAADARVELQRALDENDMKRIHTLAHQLKGAGGGYGFDIVSDTARELEQASHAGDDEALRQAHAALDDVLSRLAAPTAAAA